MTNETDIIAFQLQAVNTQLYRLRKVKEKLAEKALAAAPEKWLNNQAKGVTDTIDGELYNMKLLWTETKAHEVKHHYKKVITPILDGQKFEGKECYADKKLALHMVQPQPSINWEPDYTKDLMDSFIEGLKFNPYKP